MTPCGKLATRLPPLQLLYLALYLTLFATALPTSDALVGGALQKIRKDFLALTRRATAHHILVPNEEVALALKRRIREQCIEQGSYVVNVFEEAARKYSQDETTNYRGGLLGTLVPQGYCRSAKLDRACFEVTLGELEGPLKSEIGYHLVLVTERTNCPKLDGTNTKLLQSTSDDVFGTLVPAKQVGQMNAPEMIANQLGFWVLVFFGGGLMAELTEKLTNL